MDKETAQQQRISRFSPIEILSRTYYSHNEVKHLNLKIKTRKSSEEKKSSSLIVSTMKHQTVEKKDENNQSDVNDKRPHYNKINFLRRQMHLKCDISDFKRNQLRTKKLKARRLTYKHSPYITSSTDVNKILRLIQPVAGPNESLKLQIKRYNDQRINNAENIILKKTPSFSERMRIYSTRLGLRQESKIFIMNSHDVHIRAALLQNNWIQTPHSPSVFYHLKWVYSDSLSDYSTMQDGQFFNHFKNNQQLTNKNELRKNIKIAPIIMRPPFPSSYDLQVNQDQAEFFEEYNMFAAIKVILQIEEAIKQKLPELYRRTLRNKNYFCYYLQRKAKPPKFSLKLNIKYKISSQNISRQQLLVKNTENLQKGSHQSQFIKHLYFLMFYLCSVVSDKKQIVYSVFTNSRPNQILKSINIRNLNIQQQNCLQLLSDFYIVQIIKLAKHLKHLFGNNYGLDNAWIMKPTGVSRGSGITISNDCKRILQNKYGKIVQKYIESPLLLNCGRKFDIRQWVLVKSFSPLQIYIFERCYCRFSSSAYDISQYDNLQKHLTNYSKNKEVFSRSRLSISRNGHNSSVMSEQELENHIGKDKWHHLKVQIQQIIYQTIVCCKNNIFQREGCFEVYGFDILIDNMFQPWLLEVNLSPACDNREKFLGQYLNSMAEGIVCLVEGREIKGWKQINEASVRNNQLYYDKIKLEEKASKRITRFMQKIVSSTLKKQRMNEQIMENIIQQIYQ